MYIYNLLCQPARCGFFRGGIDKPITLRRSRIRTPHNLPTCGIAHNRLKPTIINTFPNSTPQQEKGAAAYGRLSAGSLETAIPPLSRSGRGTRRGTTSRRERRKTSCAPTPVRQDSQHGARERTSDSMGTPAWNLQSLVGCCTLSTRSRGAR